MADEPAEVLMRLDHDPRLIAGVAGAASSCASAAGLGEAGAAALRRAVCTACEQAFGYGPAAGVRLEVSISWRPGRLDVTLSRPATPAEAAPPAAPLVGVDQVLRETRGGLALTILTKFIKPSVPAG